MLQDGKTVLMSSSQAGRPAVVELLLEYGAQVDTFNVVRLLLQKYLQNLEDSHRQLFFKAPYSVFDNEIHNGLDHLLNFRPVPDILTTNILRIFLSFEKTGSTALMFAVQKGLLSVVEQLLDCGAAIDSKSKV